MINLDKYSLQEKGWIIAREIIKNSKTHFVKNLAKNFEDPIEAYNWLKDKIEYKRENGDVLYEPDELVKRGKGDCEDFTVFIGSIAKAQGYPVRIKIVKNSTRHIYPLVKINNRWVLLDAVPSKVERIGDIPKGYKVVMDGILKDDLSGLSPFKKAIITGAGVAVGSGIAKAIMTKIGLGAVSKLEGIQRIEVSKDYIPEPGDHLLFYYKPKWYLPDALEEWILKKVVKRKIDNAEVLSTYFKTENGIKYLVVEVVVKETKSLGAIVMTVAAIGAVLLIGGLAAYFTLYKIEKIVKTEEMSTFMKIMPYAFLFYALAKLIGR